MLTHRFPQPLQCKTIKSPIDFLFIFWAIMIKVVLPVDIPYFFRHPSPSPSSVTKIPFVVYSFFVLLIASFFHVFPWKLICCHLVAIRFGAAPWRWVSFSFLGKYYLKASIWPKVEWKKFSLFLPQFGYSNIKYSLSLSVRPPPFAYLLRTPLVWNGWNGQHIQRAN